MVVMRVVSEEEEKEELMARLERMSEKERLCTVVVMSGNVTDLSTSLQPLTVLTPDMFLLVEDGDLTSRDSLLLSILAEVSTYTGKLLTLPSRVSLEEVPAVEVSSLRPEEDLTENNPRHSKPISRLANIPTQDILS